MRSTPKGKNLNVRLVARLGELFGQEVIFPTVFKHRYHTTAYMKEKGTVYSVSVNSPAFLRFQGERSENFDSYSRWLLSEHAQIVREEQTKFRALVFGSMPEKIAWFLLEESTSNIVISRHEDVADAVGTYRETATQVLNALQDMGLIELGRNKITIVNREALERLKQSM